MKSIPVLSVVVCSYNGASKLAKCLEALDRQTIRDSIEIIVVDDGSTDGTASIARQFDVDVVVHEANCGLSMARNTGIRRSRAAIVAFTDDDCVPADNWLESVLIEYRDQSVLGVGGTVAPLSTDGALLRYLEANNPLAPVEVERTVSSSVAYRAYLYMRRNAKAPKDDGRRSVYSLVGANFSARRCVLDAIGLFDDRITFGGDEEDVCRRLRAHYPEGRLVYSPAAMVYHDYDPHVRDTLRRSYAYGKGSARAFLKNPQQFPTVFPLPVAVVALAAVGFWKRSAAGLACVLPLVAFPRWPLEAVRNRRIEFLGYSYIQLLQEASSDVGFARSFAQLRSEYRDPIEVSR